MVDNVPITAGTGTTIATDDVGGVHYPINKLAHGALDTATLVTSATPLPIYGPDITATGNITARDAVVAAPAGAGATVTGASTAGSLVAIQCGGGDSAWNLQVSGTWTGTLYYEVSLDSTNGTDGNWINVNGRQTGTVNTVLGGSTTANGVFRGNTSGVAWMRVRSAAASHTGTAAIVLRVSDGTGAIFLNASIPAGTNAIGSITSEPGATFRGRATTFRTPGRAGTTGQKIFALHNATASTKVVHINKIDVDLVQLAVIAVTVLPVIVRLQRFTAVPTNGTVLTKVAKDTALSSNASVTAWGDASADGTGSATTLTVTLPAGGTLAEEFSARLITAAGYEPFDKEEFLVGYDVVLRPLEGICLYLDYALATSNPTTNHWIVGCDWWEV